MEKFTTRPDRQYYIDWVRTLAMLMVFFFHCARFFDTGGWHVKSGEISYGMTVFVDVVAQWLMPLFFVLSGISSFYALTYLTSKKYINARIKRLVVPLVFGIFTHVALQVYLERLTHGQFSGSFFAFYPHYFDGFYAFGGNFAWVGLHLWYLEMLFLFSLVTLPLFTLMKSQRAEGAMESIGVFLTRPGAIFLLAVPLSIVETLSNLYPESLGVRDFGGWALFPHLIFFLSGFLLASHSRFRPTLVSHRFVALGLGVIATLFGYVLVEVVGVSTRGWFFSCLRAFNSWFWLVAILGFGGKRLDFNNRLLKYASEAVLPFYILHQSVILVIGYFIMDWTAPVLIQYLFLSATSFLTIMVIYEIIVRRINVMRFLFGMKPQRLLPVHATNRISGRQAA